MNEFDDRQLGDALRRRAGAAADWSGVAAARSAVVAQADRVRRRRATAAGGATMAGLVAAAVLVIGPGRDWVVTTPGQQTNRSTPAFVDITVDATSPVPTDQDQTRPDHTVIGTASPAANSMGPVTTLPPTGPPTGTSPSATSPAASGTPVPPASGTIVHAPPTPPTPPTSPEPTPSTSAAAPTTTTAPDPETITETYSSAGGSITVGWDGSALSLLEVSAAVGFAAEVEDEQADRIRVRFEGDGGDFRIVIRLEDGEIVRDE
jgi:hypothetical protein